MGKSPEKYIPPEEIEKAEGTMTDEEKNNSEYREEQHKQLETFVEAVKEDPSLYEELMTNMPPSLVTRMAKAINTPDGLVYVTTQDLRSYLGKLISEDKNELYFDKKNEGYPFKPGEFPTDLGQRKPTIKVKEQGKFKVFREKPKSDPGSGVYEYPGSPKFVVGARNDVDTIKEELKKLMEEMDLVETEDHTPTGIYEYADKQKSTLYVFKHKDGQKK